MVVTPRHIVTLVKLEQSRKAFSSMVVTLSGMVILVKLVHKKAFAAISVTGSP